MLVIQSFNLMPQFSTCFRILFLSNVPRFVTLSQLLTWEMALLTCKAKVDPKAAKASWGMASKMKASDVRAVWTLLVLGWDVMTKMSLRFPWITDTPSSPLLWSWRCSQKKFQSASAIDSYRRSFLLLLFPGPQSNGSDHKASWSFARAFTLSSGFARVSCESFCRKSPESCKPECLGRGHETCASLRSVYFLLLHFLAAKMFLRTQKSLIGSTASSHLLWLKKSLWQNLGKNLTKQNYPEEFEPKDSCLAWTWYSWDAPLLWQVSLHRPACFPWFLSTRFAATRGPCVSWLHLANLGKRASYRMSYNIIEVGVGNQIIQPKRTQHSTLNILTKKKHHKNVHLWKRSPKKLFLKRLFKCLELASPCCFISLTPSAKTFNKLSGSGSFSGSSTSTSCATARKDKAPESSVSEALCSAMVTKESTWPERWKEIIIWLITMWPLMEEL